MSINLSSLSESATKGFAWTTISAIGNVFFLLVQYAIMGRMLSAEDFGIMAMIMTVVGFFSGVSDFGLGSHIVQDDNISIKSIVRFLQIVLILTSILAVIISFASGIISSFYNNIEIYRMIPWVSLSIIQAGINQILFSILQKSLAFKQIAFTDIITNASSVILAGILAYLGYGVWALIFSLLFSGLVRIIVSTLFVFKFLTLFPKFNQSESEIVGEFVFFQTGDRILNYLGSNFDKIIIGRFLDPISLGLYSVSFQLMLKPFSVLNSTVMRVILPLYSKIKDDNVRLGEAYLKSLKMTALISFPIFMALGICSSSILEFLMGLRWVKAAPLLYVFSILGIFFTLGSPIGAIILSKGVPRVGFYFNLITTFVYGIAFLIGSNFSIFYVAISYLISTIFIVFPLEFFLRRYLIGLTFSKYLISMKHLFIGCGVPLLIHSFFYLIFPQIIGSVTSQIIFAFFSIVFFFLYLYIYDLSFIKSIIVLLNNIQQK